MSPRRKHFDSILGEDAADFDYGDAAVWFGWKCCCCDELAYDETHLELQFFAFENCVYHDGNGVLWVRCNDCLKCIHLSCLDPNLNQLHFKSHLFVHDCKN